jgi:hypothetical protein
MGAQQYVVDPRTKSVHCILRPFPFHFRSCLSFIWQILSRRICYKTWSIVRLLYVLKSFLWIDCHTVAEFGKKQLYPLRSCMFFDTTDKSWFQPFFSDPMYLHTIVFATQGYLDILFRKRTSHPDPGAEFHLVKSLGLLRQRLSLDRESATSDITATVVLFLATHALLVGDLNSARSHLQGLRNIIALRGGLGSMTRPKLMIETFRYG